MNKFKVETPEIWKEKLFLSADNPKRKFNYRAVVAIAATTAILVFSTTGVAYSQAPEYIGSMFFGLSQENMSSIYSPKSTVFESSSDDFSLTCIGIAGDRRSMVAVFELKSNSDFSFNPEKTYFFGERGVETSPVRLNGYSIGSSSTYVDEKTLLIDLHFNAQSTNIIGETVHLEFRNITNGFGDDEVIVSSCVFKGKIKVDYPNTVVNLSKTKNTVCTDGVTAKAKKAWISNLGFEIEFKVTDGAQIIATLEDHELVFKKMTLNYIDGTSEEFILRLPSHSDRDVVVSSVSKNENKIWIKGKFPKLINSSEVVSVAIDDYVMFVK